MGKPDDIEQRDWDAACVLIPPSPVDQLIPAFDELRVRIARAIATARDEGRAEQREVFPLEWDDCDELGLCADTIIGRYWLEPDELAASSWQLRFVTLEYEGIAQHVLARGQLSAHATQAFAAADFKRRIAAAIRKGEP